MINPSVINNIEAHLECISADLHEIAMELKRRNDTIENKYPTFAGPTNYNDITKLKCGHIPHEDIRG